MKELESILGAQRKVRESEQRFAAALKGIRLDGDDGEEAPEELTSEDRKFKLDIIKARAAAVNKGEDPKKAEYAMWGLDFIEED